MQRCVRDAAARGQNLVPCGWWRQNYLDRIPLGDEAVLEFEVAFVRECVLTRILVAPGKTSATREHRLPRVRGPEIDVRALRTKTDSPALNAPFVKFVFSVVFRVEGPAGRHELGAPLARLAVIEVCRAAEAGSAQSALEFRI